MALDDYEWGFCRPCVMLVAVEDDQLAEHTSAITGRCSGSHHKPWPTPVRPDTHNEKRCPDCIDMRNHIDYERSRRTNDSKALS